MADYVALLDVIDAMEAAGCTTDQKNRVGLSLLFALEAKKRSEPAPYKRAVPVSAEEWAILRWQTLERDGPSCRYCEDPVGDDFNCDHVVAMSRGGATELENLAVSCKSCNASKGSRDVNEWLASRA